MVDGIKITYSRLKKLDSGFLDMTTVPMKTNEQQTTLLPVKDTCVPKVQAQGGEANGTLKKTAVSTGDPSRICLAYSG